MKKLNNKGITLVALVITIIVLLILSSIATYSGLNVVKSSKLTVFTTEMKIMQTKVNEIYQKYKDGNSIEIDGTIYYGENKKSENSNSTILDIGQALDSVSTQANKVFTESASGITNKDGYKYWNNELVKKLGIEGVDGDFFVNVEKRSIVSYDGFTYEGKDYYTLNQLPSNLYNVDYENKNDGKPTFDITSEKISANKWKVTISNIQYTGGYIEKWYVKYKKQEQENWQTREDMSFTISEKGTYTIKIENDNISSEEKTLAIGLLKPGETADKTEKNNYVDDDGDNATIPEGFTVSEKDKEKDISDGLVVIGPDGSEFVWVPVPDINSMSQCSTAGGDCNLQLENGVLKCKTHDKTDIVGKLYATETGEKFGTVNTTYDANSGLREPAYLTNSSYADASKYNTIGLTLSDMQGEYRNMAANVAKYGGFYVGRYETSLSDAKEDSAGTKGTAQSKKDVIPTSAENNATSSWYGLYSKQKEYTGKNGSVESSMIWGSQYDAMLNWAKNGTDKAKITNESLGNNSSGNVTTTGNDAYANDSINNIRDLGGNLFEWTLEAGNTDFRVFRGSYYGFSLSPSYRDLYIPFSTNSYSGSRLALYVK